jgi:hypothetical protein
VEQRFLADAAQEVIAAVFEPARVDSVEFLDARRGMILDAHLCPGREAG